MITPKWLSTRIQPIAIRDVLRYLVGCATLPSEMCRAFDIGGPEVLTYEQMMQRYAAVAGLPRRIVVKTPFLTPSLSSHWVGLVTPVPGSIARPLVESLRNEVVVSDRDIAQWIPDPPRGCSASTRPFDWRSHASATSTSRRAGPRRRRPVPRAIRYRPTRLGRRQPVRRRALQRRRREQGDALASHRGHRRRERLVLVAAGLAVRGIVDRLQGGPACAAAGAIRTTCRSATPWTGGESRRSMTSSCFACAPKCVSRASRGSS